MDGHLTEHAPGRANGHVVVLGGGITGLAAAHRLVKDAPGVRVTLVEAEDRLGGKIATERVDGFVIEAGPDSFLSSKPRGVGLSEEVGLGNRLIGVTPREKRAFILHAGRLHDLPEGLTGLVPTRLGPLARSSLLSPVGKARIALDYLIPARKGQEDEPLGAFVRRRLGDEAWERMVEPLMAGIYGGNGDDLSLAATFPQLREAERRHGGLIRGVLAARAAAPPSTDDRPRSAFLKPAGGLGDLVHALERRLHDGGAAIRTGIAAASISRTGNTYDIRLDNGETLTADALIVATPASAASHLLADIDSALAGELAAIPHTSSTIVTLAFRREQIPHPLAGHGYVVPRVEGSPILAGTWSSRKWAGVAPEGREVLRVFLGRAGMRSFDAASMDDATLIALAREEVATRLGASGPPVFARVHRWLDGMPQYVMGHPERVVRIEQATLAHPGLLLAGAAYRGVGIPDCIASGERAARSAIDHLSATAVTSGVLKMAEFPEPAGSRAEPR